MISQPLNHLQFPSTRCRPRATFISLLALVALTLLATANASAMTPEPLGRYIVVFKGSVEHPGNVANAQVAQHDGRMKGFFGTSFDGYAVTLPKDQVDELRTDPNVDYVERDRKFFPAIIPTGVQRIFGPVNKELSIDDINNRNADVDVAVIDSGVDSKVADLNVAGGVDCVTDGKSCVENGGIDEYGHGTSVAGVIGARDNGIGAAGVAPGARLWSVQALDSEGGFSWGSSLTRSADWVTAHASTIEVANMSFIREDNEGGEMTALKTAIDTSIEAGVVYVAAAGNHNQDVSTNWPASFPNVITVSAIADSDGIPNGDAKASFSNWGAGVDIAAPGTSIQTWLPGGKTTWGTGTSFAAPHVAGAAAIIASRWGKNPNTKADVEAIRNTLVEKGNYDWTDTSPDGIKEPLLDVSNEATFSLLESPKNTALPVVSPESPSVGTVVSTTVGTWTNSPNNYAYQWQRCNAAGAECVDISGATKSTYTAAQIDGKKTLVSKVTATNSGGQVSALSKATKAVLTPPTVVTEPAVVTKTGSVYKAELKGTVNPNGVATTRYLEWGTTAAYGSKSTEVSVGSGSSPVGVSYFLNSLPEGTTYHFRVVAKSAEGTSYGGDRVLFAEPGQNWALQSPVNPAGSAQTELKDISCLAGGECIAVGIAASLPLSERWTGTEWKQYATVPAGTGGSFESVSCTSATACTAVGYKTVSGVKKALAARWTGAGWTPQESLTATNALQAVSCASATECIAVSNAFSGYSVRWNGTEWSAPVTVAGLQDVSCTSSTFCMGVGAFEGIPVARTWNGSTWTTQKAPAGLSLSGVSCTAANACTAVGMKEGAGSLLPLAARWNGTEWITQVVPSAPEMPVSVLEGVSCVSATVCVGTGFASNAAGTLMGTFTVRWNGTSWTFQYSPNPAGGSFNRLSDVSCIPTVTCEAVGTYKDAKNNTLPIAERSS